MEKNYKRADNIDDLIHSVKLPYLAWKTLFLIGEQMEIDKISEILGESDKKIGEMLVLLENEKLIIAEKVETSSKEDVKSEKTEPVKAEEKVEAVVEEKVESESEKVEQPASPVEQEKVVEKEVEEEKKEDESSLIADALTETVEDEEDGELPEELLSEIEDGDDVDVSEADLLSGALENSLIDEDSSAKQDVVEENKDADLVEKETSAEVESSSEKVEAEEDTVDLGIDFDTPEVQKTEPQAVAKEPENTAAKEGQPTILVIDDSIVIRKMVEIALEDANYHIESAVNGKSGLEIADKVDPKLVIVDLMLPDINGIDILKTIKASKGVPVIMLSGKDTPQMIEKAKAEGADEFLPKPFKDEELVEKINSLLK